MGDDVRTEYRELTEEDKRWLDKVKQAGQNYIDVVKALEKRNRRQWTAAPGDLAGCR